MLAAQTGGGADPRSAECIDAQHGGKPDVHGESSAEGAAARAVSGYGTSPVGDAAAHALGTLIGAILAAKLGVKYKITLAFVIGFFFLAGGIMVNYLIPGPTWFAALDLAVAYLPMAWIGGKIGSRLKK